MRGYLILAVALQIVLLAALLATLPALAKVESFTLGSYKVSYDLNETSEHDTVIAKPRYSETFSGIAYVGYGAQITMLEPPHYLITMAIIEYRYPVLLGPINGTTNRLLSTNSDCKNVETVQRTIDDHRGYLTTSSGCRNDTEGFVTQFLLDGTGESGTAECLIASTYPRESGTSSLLKTIHIERLPP